MRIYGTTRVDQWQRVLAIEPDGARLDPTPVSFADAWAAPLQPPAQAPSVDAAPLVPWCDFRLPIHRPELVCWAYAMTYPDHRREVRIADTFRFRKLASPIPVPPVTQLRDGLDFEGEIGVLIHRHSPDRYGFVMLNDLTDRGLQVRHFDRRDRIPGFERAKNFEQALQLGPLIAIGSAADWPALRLTVRLNGEIRQTLHAQHCVVTPDLIRGDILPDHPDRDWLLACTGTPAGVIFRAPSLWEKLRLIIRSGLRMTTARDRWLQRFTFLQDGDVLEMRSDTLGASRTTFRAHPPEPDSGQPDDRDAVTADDPAATSP